MRKMEEDGRARVIPRRTPESAAMTAEVRARAVSWMFAAPDTMEPPILSRHPAG